MTTRLTHWLAVALLGLAQSSSGLGGIWSLNRAASEFPRELGFGNTGSSGLPLTARRESPDDAQRLRVVTDEARNPPARLVIVDNLTAVTLTNELGQSRTVHPTGRNETVEIQGKLVPVTSVRDGEKVVVTYHVEEDRDVRYSYSPAGTPPRLTVETQFLEHGTGDKVTRIYESGELVAAAAPGRPASAPASPPLPALPASGSSDTLDQRPGAEFKGLKDVGVLVEDLGPEATACGLKRQSIEDALANKLRAGGLNVRKNSDEDTYVYVNIITSSTPAGSCTSRYDAFLYTHAPAKLAYREQPVLVQVSLIHRGGMGTSGVAGHAAAVSRGLESYMDVFLSQIQNANR